MFELMFISTFALVTLSFATLALLTFALVTLSFVALALLEVISLAKPFEFLMETFPFELMVELFELLCI